MVAVRVRPILLVVLVSIAICGGAGSTQWAKADDSACGDPSSGNFWEGAVKPEECRLLRQFPDLARRDGKRLVIKLASGRSRVFEDHGECWFTNCATYYLAQIKRDNDVVIIWKPPLEGSGVILLDRQSGDEVEMYDFPEVSADERYWAVVDGGAAFSSGTTQVLLHENGRFQLVGEMNRELCLFKSWNGAPAFLLLCYDRAAERTKEYRAVVDGKGGLVLSETQQALSPEEGGFPF